MKTIHLLMAAAAALAVASPASAATEDTLTFTGEVVGDCDVSVTSNGTLVPAGDGKTIGSASDFGGTSGRVRIEADEGYQALVSGATVRFDDNSTAFNSEVAARLGGETVSTAQPIALRGGEQFLDVDVEISRVDDGDLGMGRYDADVTVTCEPDGGPAIPQ